MWEPLKRRPPPPPPISWASVCVYVISFSRFDSFHVFTKVVGLFFKQCHLRDKDAA
jgi:hypothetical protein